MCLPPSQSRLSKLSYFWSGFFEVSDECQVVRCTSSSPRRGLLHVLIAASRVPQRCLRRITVFASQPETVAASLFWKGFHPRRVAVSTASQFRRLDIFSCVAASGNGFPLAASQPYCVAVSRFSISFPLKAGFAGNPCSAAGQMFFLKSIRPVDRSCRRLVRGFERGLCSWVCARSSEVGLLAPRRGVGFATS